MACSEQNELIASAGEERITRHKKSGDPLLNHRRERCVDLPVVAGVQHVKLQSDIVSSGLHNFLLGTFTRRVHQHREECGRWDQLTQQFQSFPRPARC